MAGQLKVNQVQLGDSLTDTQNFVWQTNVDGTAKLARGNVGATTQDILTVNAAGAVALLGTTTNGNAAAGQVGEYIESSIPVGSAISLVTATTANVTSISLTAGDWDVGGVVSFVLAGTTSITSLFAASATASLIFPANPERFSYNVPASVPGNTTFNGTVPTRRISLAATTTVYLICQGTFTVSTLTAYGRISARRVR